MVEVKIRRSGATADTWTEALLHFKPDPPGRAGEDAEQLGLVGEVHLLIIRAIAQAEHVIQLPHGFLDPLGALKRAIVDGRVIVTRASHNEKLRRGSPGELEKAEIPPVAFHRDVEARP